MTQTRIIISTVSSESDARSVSKQLLESRLCACVTTTPGAKSMYWWKGKIVTEPELVLTIKTSEQCLDQAVDKLKSIHPYDNPEIVVLKPQFVVKEYEQWVQNEFNQN